MDLDDILRVDRCRDMDELISFWALYYLITLYSVYGEMNMMMMMMMMMMIQQPDLHGIFEF